jgi:hypothetical protein
VIVNGDADSSPSSPDASREEGCKRSVVEDLGIFVWKCEELRLRFPTLDEDGEDIASVRAVIYHLAKRCMNVTGNDKIYSIQAQHRRRQKTASETPELINVPKLLKQEGKTGYHQLPT